MMEHTQTGDKNNDNYIAFNLPDEEEKVSPKDFQDNGLQFINTNYELNSEPTTPAASPMTSIKFTALPEGNILFDKNTF